MSFSVLCKLSAELLSGSCAVGLLVAILNSGLVVLLVIEWVSALIPGLIAEFIGVLETEGVVNVRTRLGGLVVETEVRYVK